MELGTICKEQKSKNVEEMLKDELDIHFLKNILPTFPPGRRDCQREDRKVKAWDSALELWPEPKHIDKRAGSLTKTCELL